jgi:hypothetical protein
MKRFLVLLVILAGALAWAVIVVPTNAAVVNGTGISQSSLNHDVTAIAKSAQYQCYLNAQEYLESNEEGLLPPAGGVGYGTQQGLIPTATTAFAATYLDTVIGHQLVSDLAADRHITVSSADLASARTSLVAEITEIMSEVSQTSQAENTRLSCGSSQPLEGQDILDSMPSSFVNQQVQFLATINALEEDLSGVGHSGADLESYFNAHLPTFTKACITVAQYSTKAEAEAGIAQVKAGTPFSTVAAATSGGGPQQCIVLYNVIASLPASADLAKLPLNTLTPPISYQDAYLVLEITSREKTTYADAAPEVERAVQVLGSAKSQKAIQAAERRASVQVDARYGTWHANVAQVIVPLTPPVKEVINPSANSPAVAATDAFGAAAPSTGQSG